MIGRPVLAPLLLLRWCSEAAQLVCAAALAPGGLIAQQSLACEVCSCTTPWLFAFQIQKSAPEIARRILYNGRLCCSALAASLLHVLPAGTARCLQCCSMCHSVVTGVLVRWQETNSTEFLTRKRQCSHVHDLTHAWQWIRYYASSNAMQASADNQVCMAHSHRADHSRPTMTNQISRQRLEASLLHSIVALASRSTKLLRRSPRKQQSRAAVSSGADTAAWATRRTPAALCKPSQQ